MKNIIDRISHIESCGSDYQFFKLYFRADACLDKDEKVVVLNEKEFLALDKLYKGNLAIKVIN